MAVVVGVAAAVVLVVLGRLAVGVLASALVGAADAELRRHAEVAAVQLSSGAAADTLAGPSLRVVDTAGQPVDGGPVLPLSAAQMRDLASGEAIVAGGPDGLRRWLAAPAVLPDGSTRLVIVTGDVIGGTALLTRAAAAFVLGALGAAVVVGGAAWLGTRAALRPVDRMRAAAAALPPGERLPVPAAHDELRALTEELNRLLARRDEAARPPGAVHRRRGARAAVARRGDPRTGRGRRAAPRPADGGGDPAGRRRRGRPVVVPAGRPAGPRAGRCGPAPARGRRRPGRRRSGRLAGPSWPHRRTARADLRLGCRRARRADPAAVAATPSEVALVLDNLIDNGRRYARSVVRVVVLPAGRWVRLLVEDDGPGIPEDDRQRVFDRFTRLRPEAGGGSGLGLALVAALVQGRGGTATASATPTGGARLEIRWPTPPADRRVRHYRYGESRFRLRRVVVLGTASRDSVSESRTSATASRDCRRGLVLGTARPAFAIIAPCPSSAPASGSTPAPARSRASCATRGWSPRRWAARGTASRLIAGSSSVATRSASTRSWPRASACRYVPS